MISIELVLKDTASLVNNAMEQLLRDDGGNQLVQGSDILLEAMRYATLSGGKRLRPFLLLESAAMFGVETNRALRAAMAIEFVHCYSLVHDDLPAMDNDDLRRGKPTVHKAYSESTAILAGSALLTLAFETIASSEMIDDPQIKCALIDALAKAAGQSGLIAGQMLDLDISKPFNHSVIKKLQLLKTAKMIEAAVVMGAILGKANDGQLQALRAFALDIGIAFQIIDDLLDYEGSQDITGKAVNKDANCGKITLHALLGVDAARSEAKSLIDNALEHLSIFGKKAERLRQLSHFIIERRA